MINRKWFHYILTFLLIVGCASTMTQLEHYEPIMMDLHTGNFENAVKKIDNAKKSGKYSKKDRVLYYLDKGAVLYFNGEYEKSNNAFEKAELAMEELFTKSISKAAGSLLLNDNILDYSGEIYENIYINIFKSLNYLNLGKFDDAYVETKRVNDKLRALADKYDKLVTDMNKSGKSKVEIQTSKNKFYDDVLTHYLSYLIFSADGEYDNCRISLQKLKTAWDENTHIYDHNIPDAVKNKFYFEPSGDELHVQQNDRSALNIIAFTGLAPTKEPVGGLITTYDDAVGVSELDVPIPLPNIAFPGMKPGFHFKFSLPVLKPAESAISRIEIMADGVYLGNLDLLEDMGKIAIHTFEQKKDIIYFKTILRTVTKGLAAAKAKEKIKKETGSNGFFTTLLNAAVDVGVDATENADLRCWRTMPNQCYIGEFDIDPGVHNITINFLNSYGSIIQSKSIEQYTVVHNGFNLIDAVSLN
ncbi:MAG: COG3014 family protein [Calditrichaceae bacterium]